MSYNFTVQEGRFTADPVLKQTSNGISFCNFQLAVDRAYQSGEDKQTDFLNFTAWRQRAEFISKYFRKGDGILVDGEIQTRKYQDKNGNDRVATEIIVNNARFPLTSKSQSARTSPAPAQNNTVKPVTGNESFTQVDNDDDLPF